MMHAQGDQAALPGEPGSASIAERFGQGLSAACSWSAAAALAVIVVVNFANVVGRYFFGKPLAWAEELMLYFMIYVVFAGAIVASWRGAHIGIDALVTRMPKGLQYAAMVSTSIVAVVLMLMIANAGFSTVSMLFSFDQRSDALDMPMWIPQSVVVAGLAISAAVVLLRLYVSVTRTVALKTEAPQS